MEQFGSILFIDIETVSAVPAYDMLSPGMQVEWDRKARLVKRDPDTEFAPEQIFEDRAGIYSEFAKVVCISCGSLYPDGDGFKLRLKSIAGDNETDLLSEFASLLEKITALHREVRFCGHNIKEFDIPFLCRRFVINNLALPVSMQLSGKKPWEINHIDTMDMWKFGDIKNFTSLSLLAQVLGIPTPKGDIDGSQVGHVYWKDHDIDRISEYCMRDVLTSARVYLRLRGMGTVTVTADYA